MERNIFAELTTELYFPIQDDEFPEADGIIKDCYQGLNGDCWLISAIIALSYCEKGREAIKNSIKKNYDGSINIYFKGINHSYRLEKDEINEAKYSMMYAKGDLNIILFELAIDKYRKDIYKNKIEFDDDVPYYIDHTNYNPFKKLKTNGGYPEQVFFLLTGKESYSLRNPSQMVHFLSRFAINKNHSAMCCWFNKYTENKEKYTVIKDIYNNKIEIMNSHAFAVKDVDLTTQGITIVNPHNTTYEFVIDMEFFCLDAYLSYCDLEEFSRFENSKGIKFK